VRTTEDTNTHAAKLVGYRSARGDRRGLGVVSVARAGS
jgi:hypothetical protein